MKFYSTFNFDPQTVINILAVIVMNMCVMSVMFVCIKNILLTSISIRFQVEKEPGIKTWVGGGKVLHRLTKQIVYNLYNFMQREAYEGPIVILNQIEHRLSEVTGMTRIHIQKILKKGCHNLPTTHKKQPGQKKRENLY